MQHRDGNGHGMALVPGAPLRSAPVLLDGDPTDRPLVTDIDETLGGVAGQLRKLDAEIGRTHRRLEELHELRTRLLDGIVQIRAAADGPS